MKDNEYFKYEIKIERDRPMYALKYTATIETPISRYQLDPVGSREAALEAVAKDLLGLLNDCNT